MKKVIIALVISLLVLVSAILWLILDRPFIAGESIQFVVIIIMVGFGLFFAFRRLNSTRKGQPQEDELSKKILQKSAALSYYISLYLWLVIMYLTDKYKGETEVMFGWGILGMAVIFGLSWIFNYFRGVGNE
jgi:peptidoglycan/LPS O-acetylase OafA/YrhL